MHAFIYRAALICEGCARRVMAELGTRPADATSDEYPDGPWPAGGGESDSPQHCDMGDACVAAFPCPTEGHAHLQGKFLENPLTIDGRDYVRQAIREAGGCVARELWGPFYGIE